MDDFALVPTERPTSGVCGAAPDWPHWYRLAFDYRITLAHKLKLLKHFGLVERIFEATHQECAHVIGQAAALAMGPLTEDLSTGITATRAWLDGDSDRSLLNLSDTRYPPQLLQLSDPPLFLYVCGQAACLSQTGLAVVGSRSASPQGIENARAFARAVGEAGFSVISGLALGIDAAAHEGALQAGTPTIALIGTGIDRVYPAANRGLAQRIRPLGALVSELPLGTPPLQHHFPRRNRLIAALARGVLVVEAARKSGSLITASLAADLGREIFAIPGSIHSPVSKGCHHLIKQGAKLVETAQDIIEELRPAAGTAPLFPEEPKPGRGSRSATSDDPILMALGFDPVLLSELLRRCTLPAGLVSKRLLELELDGRIARLDDGRLLQIVEAS